LALTRLTAQLEAAVEGLAPLLTALRRRIDETRAQLEATAALELSVADPRNAEAKRIVDAEVADVQKALGGWMGGGWMSDCTRG
jgi:hypothetical protein